jgi:hypothetical protein
LVIGTRRARNEMAGIENLSEEVITEMKDHNPEQLDETTDEADEAHRRMPAKD